VRAADAQQSDLASAVEQLAWKVVREKLGIEPDEGRHSDLPDPDLRQMWLTAITSLLAIRDCAEQLAASAALSAAQRGADYPAIGAAAGMTRQGARRKWPGLAGLSDERQRKTGWWNSRGDQFAQCVRAVVATSAESPHVAGLRAWLADIEGAAPQRTDALDLALVDAVAVAVGGPPPAEPGAARACGLLAALTADAYAAMGSQSALASREGLACATGGCRTEPVVQLWRPDQGQSAVPACRAHAVEVLGQRPETRIVAAYWPDVALSVFAEADDRAAR
jgi:hypothetical protein